MRDADEWLPHPSGLSFRQVGNAVHIRGPLRDGVTDVFPIKPDPRLADVKAALDDALNQIIRMSDELENLRTTTAEDKRHMDRQAEEIAELRTIRARIGTDGRLSVSLPVVPMDGPKVTLHVTGPIGAAQSHWASPADDVDELRATIVRQANEITALKGESA